MTRHSDCVAGEHDGETVDEGPSQIVGSLGCLEGTQGATSGTGDETDRESQNDEEIDSGDELEWLLQLVRGDPQESERDCTASVPLLQAQIRGR